MIVTRDGDTRLEQDGTVERGDGVEFGDLSLPQRVFVAAVQNPARGVIIVALFAFAFSFYIAFWMAFPRVAAFLSALAVGVGVLAILTYYALKRLF